MQGCKMVTSLMHRVRVLNYEIFATPSNLEILYPRNSFKLISNRFKPISYRIIDTDLG